MPDVSGGPAVREARSRANRVLGTGGHDAGHDSASRSVKAHFCDRHHIASATAELASHLSIVPHMRFSRSTFLRNTQPRSRGAFFAPSPETARPMFRPLFRASVTRLTKPLWFPL